MGAMKDLSIEIDEAVRLFEENFRALPRETPVTQDAWAARSNAYDAFYDLKAVLDRVLDSGNQTPEPSDNIYDTYAVPHRFVVGVSDVPDFGQQLRELSAQVASLAAVQAASIEADLAAKSEEALPEPEDVPRYSTGQTLHVTMYDGSTYSIENVDSFHLSIDKTGEWPVGWDVGDEPDTEHRAGYWDSEAEFHAFDSRYRPSAERWGW